MMYGPADGGWWGFGMMLISLLFVALIVIGAVFVARSFSHGEQPPQRSEGSRALDILEERYARGDIDQSEYEERRRTLSGSG